MKKFLPYYALLKGARGKFAAGVLAGVLYAVTSGFGLPFMVKVVFPIIFDSEQVAGEGLAVPGGPDTGGAEKPSFPLGETLTTARERLEMVQDKEAVREFFKERWGAERGPRLLLIAACSMIPLIAALRGLAGFLNVYWITAAGLHILLRLQQNVFDKLQRLPLGFFSGRKSGDLVSRMIQDTFLLQTMLTTVANDLLKQPFTLVAALCYLAYDSFAHREGMFLIIFLLSVPVVVLPVRMIGKRLMRRAAHMQREGGDNTAILTETLGAPREIRAFNLQDMMSRRFLKGITRWTALHLKVVRYRFSTPPVIEVVAAGAVAAALGYGATKGYSLERFLAIVMALYMCYDPAKKLGEVHNRLKQSEASLDRLETILGADEDIKDPEHPVEIASVRGELGFRQVDFRYEDNPALRDISVDIPAGQVVALVGPSGAGKTTFASMVMRFYDPDSGVVTLDGIDIRQLRVGNLRNFVTLVPQEAILLAGTIAENIRLGRLTATMEEIREAARLANAEDFILEKPGGYNTEVGERGAQLSGGQRQRIAIARAFLKNAPLLVLDEATAALDSESESQIQHGLATLAQGRTTLIIAHRFSSIRIADRILVFDEGRIVGDGTFDELATSHPLFRKLLENQR